MSVLVDEAIADIENNPETFFSASNTQFGGFENDIYRVYFGGNTKILSIINLDVNGVNITLSWWDKYRLERASLWWWKNVPTENIKI